MASARKDERSLTVSLPICACLCVCVTMRALHPSWFFVVFLFFFLFLSFSFTLPFFFFFDLRKACLRIGRSMVAEGRDCKLSLSCLGLSCLPVGQATRFSFPFSRRTKYNLYSSSPLPVVCIPPPLPSFHFLSSLLFASSFLCVHLSSMNESINQ